MNLGPGYTRGIFPGDLKVPMSGCLVGGSGTESDFGYRQRAGGCTVREYLEKEVHPWSDIRPVCRLFVAETRILYLVPPRVSP